MELAVQAQAVLRREVTVPILTDLYSTAYEVQPEEVTCPVLHLLGQGEEQESVREVVGTQGLPGNLLDVQARLGRTGQSQEGEGPNAHPGGGAWWQLYGDRGGPGALPAKKWWCSIACPARAAGRRCSPRSFSGNPPLRRREREWRFLSPWPSAGWFWKRRRPR
ncbi:MAG: hypothetical protein ACLT9P_08085 [Evtepia gabavorous]